MKDNKNYIPYVITMYGTLNTESNEYDKQLEELYGTNIQYLISKADEKFVEPNKDKGEIEDTD